ncbi:MAG TPA: Gfo/Idh/MocA family oxidoreductase [Bryobacteraceae bacterium]|nr:Gfo/Idh/MocA family oxidoreductase [Bryobacteraceae bacterium]
MKKIRTVVIGAGAFGKNHARILHELYDVELAGIVDIDEPKGAALSQTYSTSAYRDIEAVIGNIDAAIVATPTSTHEEVATRLLQAGVDVLVEKPIASSSAAGERLAKVAEENGRILQVGHLERFNPAVTALENAITIPLFFEVHRLSVFTPRSLDVDVLLDLMIHDLDIVLNLVRAEPQEIRAAGISVLSGKVDIANVRLSFASGCVANLTASRVSTEKIRKLRIFQPREYISIDYQKQEAIRLAIRKNEPNSLPEIGFESLKVAHGEPLRLELTSFFESVRSRHKPRVDGQQASAALRVAEAIAAKIKEHANLVAGTVRAHR